MSPALFYEPRRASASQRSRPSSSKSKFSVVSQTPQSNLVNRHGSKCHTFSKSTAPYPFSYNREVMEMNLLDRALMYRTNNSVTFMDYKDKPPKKVLDLGCGLGSWVVDAAKRWPKSEFVGFDLVDIQINLAYVEPSVARRIRWMHGNFLERLPFEDNEFDHVHLFTIAFAVPEDKWHKLFDEIHRILKPGGRVEQIEEDARFPVLPRWFTQPLHNASVKRGSNRNNADPTPPKKHYPVPPDLPHDHALLEMLFDSVFANRFINSKPSSILPGYFSATFSHVISPPILYFPMPPLAPLPPFPREIALPNRPSISVDTKLPPHPPSAATSPTSASSTLVSSVFSSASESAPRSAPSHTHSHVSKLPGLQRIDSISTIDTVSPSTDSHSAHSGSSGSSEKSIVRPSLAQTGDTVEIGGAARYQLFAMHKLDEFNDEHTLYMHLHRAVSLVYAAKEAMWDELWALAAHGSDQLAEYGWEAHEYAEEACRERFDGMWDRYKEDMHARISLWHPMTEYGWTYPRQDPVGENELGAQEELRRSILEAQLLVKEDEIQPTLRVIRLLVGTKES